MTSHFKREDDWVRICIYDFKSGKDLTQIYDKLAKKCDELCATHIFNLEQFQLTPPTNGTIQVTLHHGFCLEDEWIVVYVLIKLTKLFPIAARVFNFDGEFMLAEAAEDLPIWVSPEIAEENTYIVSGLVHVVQIPPNVMKGPRKHRVSHCLKQLHSYSSDHELPFACQFAIYCAAKSVKKSPNSHKTSCLLAEQCAKIVTVYPKLVQAAINALDVTQIEASIPIRKLQVCHGPLRKIQVTCTRYSYAKARCAPCKLPKVLKDFIATTEAKDLIEGSFGHELSQKDLHLNFGVRLMYGLELLYCENANLSGIGISNIRAAMKRAIQSDTVIRDQNLVDDDICWIQNLATAAEREFQNVVGDGATLQRMFEGFFNSQSGFDGVENNNPNLFHRPGPDEDESVPNDVRGSTTKQTLPEEKKQKKKSGVSPRVKRKDKRSKQMKLRGESESKPAPFEIKKKEQVTDSPYPNRHPKGLSQPDIIDCDTAMLKMSNLVKEYEKASEKHAEFHKPPMILPELRSTPNDTCEYVNAKPLDNALVESFLLACKIQYDDDQSSNSGMLSQMGYKFDITKRPAQENVQPRKEKNKTNNSRVSRSMKQKEQCNTNAKQDDEEDSKRTPFENVMDPRLTDSPYPNSPPKRIQQPDKIDCDTAMRKMLSIVKENEKASGKHAGFHEPPISRSGLKTSSKDNFEFFDVKPLDNALVESFLRACEIQDDDNQGSNSGILSQMGYQFDISKRPPQENAFFGIGIDNRQSQRRNRKHHRGVTKQPAKSNDSTSFDANLIENILNAYEAQAGDPGPASSMLSQMGFKLV